ncbi:MAG TPA: MFS transporter, partial [Erythrobacter sp.]|nr:MFS transporter [Erythrobacter sp.]
APLVAAAIVGAASGLASALLVYAGVVAVGSIVAALSFRLGSRTG